MSAGRTLLAVFAHPDDEVLCAAGTLALCAMRGERVRLLCATRGEHGPIADPTLATSENLAQVRAGELRCSCQRLGIAPPQFLDLPDGGVDWAGEEADAAQRLARKLRVLRPSAIVTFGPDGLYGHADHVAVSELVVRARALAADAAFADGAAPLPVPRLFFAVIGGEQVSGMLRDLAAHGAPGKLWDIPPQAFQVLAAEITATVDVGSVLERKLAAISCHRTQLHADNALRLLLDRPELASRHLGLEHFRCADGLPGDPLSVS
jgi:LmbE family N-acetylglucosaminyl deacetylase